MIDLHTHTNASDGRLTPRELVARAAAGGVEVLSVTDHDTVAACEAAANACAVAGVEFVPGIEITSTTGGLDLHVLGYFLDPHSPELLGFLADQRARRIERVRKMIERLAALGMRLDTDAILQPAFDDPARAAGRPWIARALVAAGHTATVREAFDRWLAAGRPAFVPRTAATPEEVVDRIRRLGGVASLAHPGLNRRDDVIPALAAAGLHALEAFHSEHDAETTAHYVTMADQLGLLVSGGSDYHGDDTHGGPVPGSVSLPRQHFDRLIQLRS